ncbi:hypothetical protein N8137_01600 [Porticoccaceae bacterium]|jgi:hypothetical protein|nr:hypothetical protein [Porticoccaceae bacterium]MDB9843876.1 hypothetical protein [Porticoccaceae bacterium]MDC1476799.1 hypothetical protein [Porticoccaceae bacterium]|tara:strand:+ start:4888 stop:5307 length:420 start_codon:yes stop_codon:yes gene_type:complete
MTQSFEVQGGNGRLYRLNAEEKDKELARLAGLVERGNAWATPDKLHDYSGFLQISQGYIDWLQASFDAQDQDNMRMNWKGFVADSSAGAKFLKVQDAWISKQPTLKQFVDGGGSNAPRAAAPKPAQAPVAEMPDDDIPF